MKFPCINRYIWLGNLNPAFWYKQSWRKNDKYVVRYKLRLKGLISLQDRLCSSTSKIYNEYMMNWALSSMIKFKNTKHMIKCLCHVIKGYISIAICAITDSKTCIEWKYTYSLIVLSKWDLWNIQLCETWVSFLSIASGHVTTFPSCERKRWIHTVCRHQCWPVAHNVS